MSKRWKVWSAFLIGKQDNPMMKRLRIIQTPLFGIYVHFIYREDLDRDPHDHPWVFWRIVLKGAYTEEYYPAKEYPMSTFRIHMSGRWFNKFPQSAAHRISAVTPGTVTLVIVGKKSAVWGFWQNMGNLTCKFTPWHKYVVNPVWSQEPL